MAFVSGPSAYLGRKDNTWVYDGTSTGYSPPESPDAAKPDYLPGPVSSLLDYADFKAIAKHSTGYVPQGPTTSWADVVDQSVRDQQRRERGIPNQPAAGKKPELPGQQDQQQADPEKAQREMLRQQNEAKIQATRAKLQQAQRLRQAAEQQQAGAQEKVSATKLDVDRASQQLKNAQDDLDGAPDDASLQDEVDRWQQNLKDAQAANDDARAKLSDATAQVEEATRGEDVANKELQQLEADQAQQDQQAQQADQEAQAQQDQQEQAPTDQPTEGPYGQGAATDQSNVEQGIGQSFGPPEAAPGQPDQGLADQQQDPIQRAIGQVKAQGGNADNLLDAIAAEAWKQESGRAAPNWMDPNDVKAYDEYRASWKGAFRAGQDVPLAGNLRAAAGGQNAPVQQQNAPARQGAPAQQAPYDPNQPVTPSNQPPANPNLIGGPGRPPLAGPGAGQPPGAAAQPGVGAPSAPGTPPVPGAPTTGAPGAPGATGPALDQANQTLAAAQARDAQLQKQLEQANSAASAAQKKMESAQEVAGKLSKELSSGVGSPEYRQYSLGPALNKAQGDVSAAAQQLAQARARATQTQQMLATSQQSIAAAQNLVKLASVQPPSAGPAASVARDAGDAAQAGQLLNTMLAKATPEQQQRIIADINTGGPAGTEVLRQIATQAWYKQLAAQGQTATAGGPPRDYIESWMGMFRANQTGAPLIAALKAELAKRGAVAQPGAAGVAPSAASGGPAAGVLTRPEMLRMTPQERALYDEWTRAGGSGRWEDFQQHAVAVGAPQPGNRRVYTDPRDAGINPPSQGGGPAGSVLPANAQPSAVQAGIDRGDFPATPSTTTTGYDAYIKAMRELGDTRSDSELAAEFRKNTTTYPSLQQGQTTGPANSVLQPPPAGPLPESSLTLISHNDTVPMVYGEDGTSRPLYTGKVYPPQLPPEQRGLWDEWRRAGGSGNWEQFRAHAQAVGAPEMPGRISDPRDAGVNPAGQVRPVYPVADNPDSSSGQGPMSGPAGTLTPPPAAPQVAARAAVPSVNPESIDPIVVSGRVAGVQDEQGQATIAQGIGGWLKGDPNAQWAQGHVENTARVAWHLQTGGRPEDAPPDYVNAWVANFKKGDTSSPLQEQLSNSLRSRGVIPPSDRAIQADWRATIHRIAQSDPAAYSNPANAAQMASYACSAASISAVVNGVNPDAPAKIDDVIKRMGPGLINANQGLLRGSDLSDLVPVFAQYGVEARAQNFTVDTLQQHFDQGGGPVVMSGPGWAQATGQNFPHIYVVTGADGNGVNILDSAGGNLSRLSWQQWQQATGSPANGAGVYAVAPQAGPPAPLAAAPAVRTPPSPTATPPAAPAAVTPIDFTDEPTVRAFQQDLRTLAPQIPTDVAKMSTDDFMRAWAPTLSYIQQRTGLDAGTVMGIIMAENGGGQSPLSRNGNNYFSLQYTPQDSMATGSDGRFAQYRTPQDGLARFVGMLAHPENTNYRQAWENRSNAEGFIQGLIKGGYAPSFENNQAQWRANILAGAQRYRALGL